METKITFREPKNPKKEPASSRKIDICMVSAVTMTKLCKDPGTTTFVISTTDLNLSQVAATEILDSILAEYHKFHDVFSGEKAGTLAPHRPYDLQINVEEGAKPVHGPIYSLSPPELAALREFLEEHARNGFIHPSKSPWGSPILFVKKKDGSLHLCVDFRALNRVTEKDRYPLPLISDLLMSPAPTRIYSKIDLKHAYHLVHIAEGDEPKTAFCTCYGSYEWQVMPFGFSNVPVAFQRFINEVLRDLMDVCMVGYLDNILIYSDWRTIKTMSVKSCIACALQDCMLTLRSASSTWTQWNTLDSSYPPKDCRWTPPRYPRSRIGPNHRRSEMYKLSSALPTSIRGSSMTTWKQPSL